VLKILAETLNSIATKCKKPDLAIVNHPNVN